MINWDYIENKREKYYRIYSRKMLTALRKTILPIIRESRLAMTSLMPVEYLVSDEHIRKVYTEMYMRVGKVFIKDFVRRLKNDFEEMIWEQQMQQYIDYVAGEKITLVTNYTRETIRATLSKVMDEGLEKGLSIGDIMKNLRKEITQGDYAKFTKARALRIAKTEVMTASNQGSLFAAQNVGMRYKVWLTAPFGLAKTERHNKIHMNGTKVFINETFDVDGEKMLYPGDSSQGASAGNIINCNCGMTYSDS